MLRPYQVLAINAVYKLFKENKRRVLVHMPTGSGKTTVFCTAIRQVAAAGHPCMVVVRGKDLIRQASARLTREGVVHGIVQGNNTTDPYMPVLVCSVDTLYRRKYLPPAKLLVIDEAHQTGGRGYAWLLDNYPEARILAVTATPHLKRGMRHVADELVCPISIMELIEQGFLVGARYFIPSTPDLSDVSKLGDDFDPKELSNAMMSDSATLRGDIVKYYKEKAAGLSAICFAVDVKHSLMLREQFSAAGLRVEHLDGETPEAERIWIIERLSSKELDIVCSVGVLTTGVDIPSLGAIIMARPTHSYNLWIQMLGRGTRPYPGKSHFIVLDHAGNVARHGLIEQEREACLDGAPKKAKTDKITFKTCEACYAVISKDALTGLYPQKCPECDALLKKAEAERKTDIDKKVELIEISASALEVAVIQQFIAKATKYGYWKKWILHQMTKRFGQEHGEFLYTLHVSPLRQWLHYSDPKFTGPRRTKPSWQKF